MENTVPIVVFNDRSTKAAGGKSSKKLRGPGERSNHAKQENRVVCAQSDTCCCGQGAPKLPTHESLPGIHRHTGAISSCPCLPWCRVLTFFAHNQMGCGASTQKNDHQIGQPTIISQSSFRSVRPSMLDALGANNIKSRDPPLDVLIIYSCPLSFIHCV